MRNNSIIGNLVLLVLFVLASPFIIFFYLLFILTYIVLSPFERIRYKKSSYYNILNERYFLFVTKRKSYQLFNDFIDKGQKQDITLFNEQVASYQYQDKKMIIVNDTIALNNEEWYYKGFKLNYEDIYITANKLLFNEDDLKIARQYDHFIIYEK